MSGGMGALFRECGVSLLLRRRTKTRPDTPVIQRKSDGSLWVAGAPANFGYAMRGMFSGNAGYHFYRARMWRGLLITSPRIFWRPKNGEFTVAPATVTTFQLPRWPEPVECRKIDALAASVQS